MNKKLMLFSFVMILLVGMVSAVNVEFNDRLVYSKNDLKVSLENWWGLGKTIGTAELSSHSSVSEIRNVIRGKNREVMYYDFNFSEEYIGGLGDVEFINSVTGEEINKDYYFAKAIYKDVIIYNQVCEDIINKQGENERVCKGIPTEQTEKKFSHWERLSSNDIPSGNVRIALITDVNLNDRIDGIWTIAGKKISRHAEWTESLNRGIVAYYAFNETNGTITLNNSVNNSVRNGTLFNTTLSQPNNWVTGLLGNAYSFSTNQYFNLTYIPSSTNGTISLWVNKIQDNRHLLGRDDSGANSGEFELREEGARVVWKIANSTTKFTLTGDVGLQNNTFTHIVIRWNTTGYTMFVNGTLQSTYLVIAQAPDPPAPNFFSVGAVIRGDSVFQGSWNGSIDEYGYWNIFQNDSQVDNLFNNGTGITFQNSFPFDNNPIVTLNNPINNSNLTSNPVTFAGTASDDRNLINVSLYLNGILNQTNSTPVNGSQTNFTLTLSDGTYNWFYNAWDNGSQETNSSGFRFTLDTMAPIINITSPTGEIASHVIGDPLNLNWTITDPNPDVCRFSYNNINTTVTCNDNTTTFNTVSGQQNLTFYANDTLGQSRSQVTTWTYAFLETGVTFDPNVSETSSQFFELNITTDINVLSISSILTYNGTNFTSTSTCDAGNCTISNTIDIPLVTNNASQNKSFFWTSSIFNGTSSSSIITTVRNQNVTIINLEQCDVTFTNQTLNFTVYDEQSLDRIQPFVFDGTLDFWLGGGSVKRNNSISDSANEITLCLKPEDSTMNVDAIIDYDEQSNLSNYTNRFYYFDQKQINNVSEDIRMYLLQSSESTSFILKVQDESLLPVTNALIEIHRFYPGEGIFRIVQIARTDDAGKSIGFFQTETVDYKFIIKKDGVTLLETGQQKVVPETSPFTLTFNTGATLDEPWLSQEDIPDLNSTLVWNDSSGIVTYVYIDSSGNLTLARLLVIQESLVNSSADVTICNENSTLISATLTCNVGSTDGFYVASGFISRNSVERLDKQFTFQIETFSGVVGLLGLFFGWFLVLIASFMFKFNEIAGIWAVTITILLINLFGLIKFGGVFVTAILGIAIIITWLMER